MKNEIRELSVSELASVAGGQVIGGPQHGDIPTPEPAAPIVGFHH